MFGLYQALIKNMVIGVSQDFVKKLEMIGVGYKYAKCVNWLAKVSGAHQALCLRNNSRPVKFPGLLLFLFMQFTLKSICSTLINMFVFRSDIACNVFWLFFFLILQWR